MIKTGNLSNSKSLRWEISAALTIKLILLIGLWWLLFRWQDPPSTKPDIAAHLALPSTNPVFSKTITTKESDHDR